MKSLKNPFLYLAALTTLLLQVGCGVRHDSIDAKDQPDLTSLQQVQEAQKNKELDGITILPASEEQKEFKGLLVLLKEGGMRPDIDHYREAVNDTLNARISKLKQEASEAKEARQTEDRLRQTALESPDFQASWTRIDRNFSVTLKQPFSAILVRIPQEIQGKGVHYFDHLSREKVATLYRKIFLTNVEDTLDAMIEAREALIKASSRKFALHLFIEENGTPKAASLPHLFDRDQEIESFLTVTNWLGSKESIARIDSLLLTEEGSLSSSLVEIQDYSALKNAKAPYQYGLILPLEYLVTSAEESSAKTNEEEVGKETSVTPEKGADTPHSSEREHPHKKDAEATEPDKEEAEKKQGTQEPPKSDEVKSAIDTLASLPFTPTTIRMWTGSIRDAKQALPIRVRYSSVHPSISAAVQHLKPVPTLQEKPDLPQEMTAVEKLMSEIQDEEKAKSLDPMMQNYGNALKFLADFGLLSMAISGERGVKPERVKEIVEIFRNSDPRYLMIETLAKNDKGEPMAIRIGISSAPSKLNGKVRIPLYGISLRAENLTLWLELQFSEEEKFNSSAVLIHDGSSEALRNDFQVILSEISLSPASPEPLPQDDSVKQSGASGGGSATIPDPKAPKNEEAIPPQPPAPQEQTADAKKGTDPSAAEGETSREILKWEGVITSSDLEGGKLSVTLTYEKAPNQLSDLPADLRAAIQKKGHLLRLTAKKSSDGVSKTIGLMAAPAAFTGASPIKMSVALEFRPNARIMPDLKIIADLTSTDGGDTLKGHLVSLYSKEGEAMATIGTLELKKVPASSPSPQPTEKGKAAKESVGEQKEAPAAWAGSITSPDFARLVPPEGKLEIELVFNDPKLAQSARESMGIKNFPDSALSLLLKTPEGPLLLSYIGPLAHLTGIHHLPIKTEEGLYYLVVNFDAERIVQTSLVKEIKGKSQQILRPAEIELKRIH